MNGLQVFSNPEFGSVRTLEIESAPWFVGKDVAAALGYRDTGNAIKAHVDPEDKRRGWQITTPSGDQQMVIINESGLYSLILSSKLPAAKRFKRWVTSEVLPALRKTGKYEIPQEPPAEMPAPGGELTAADYIRAASIVASCHRGKLPYVITLLERSGLDMSGLDVLGASPSAALAQRDDLFTQEQFQQIVDFVGQHVPTDWQSWSLERRRAFWAGRHPNIRTVPRDRISAIEVWCELLDHSPREAKGHLRPINTILASIPGWYRHTVRVGACYGPVHGFVRRGTFALK